MLTKPTINDQKIITCLKNVYHLDVKHISFLPLGADFNTAVYQIKTSENKNYFLKLRFGPFLDATITVPKYLSDLGIKHIIAPIQTYTGELWTNLESCTLILYPYIHGHNGIDTTISNQQWIEFGQTMKKIHSVVFPQKIACTIPHETFSLKWHESVKTFLARIEHESFQEPVAAQTAFFLKTKKNIIEKLLERTQERALLLQQNSPEFVLCHADLHKWNVLIDKDGTLYIVDWDTIIFAPKERDLMFIGAGIEGEKSASALEENLFYQGYGQTNINNAAIAYYRFERIIQDIGEYCEHIFLTKADKKDKTQSLNHLQSNFMPGGTIERALLSDKKIESKMLLKSFDPKIDNNILKIDLLKNNPSAIPTLAHIWHEVLGKIWMPEIGIEEIKALFYEELNQDIPLTYIALYNDIPVGSCTLELKGGIRPDLGPWIGDLVVDPKYQKQEIGKKLLSTTVTKAKELGFKQLYLFTFDHAISEYYQHLGWNKIGMDTFKSHPVIVMKIDL